MQERKKEKKGVLSLTSNEKRVWKVLPSFDGFLLSKVTELSKLPRTTVKRTLSSLLSRNLVKQSPKGKRTVWQRNDESLVANELGNNISLLGFSMKKTAVPGLALIHGDALIQTVISFVESLPHGGVFNGIQPTASALLSIEKTGVKEVARLNELIKRKKILVRGVLGNNYPKRLHKVYGNVWLQSFLGRTAHFVTVPEEYLSHGAELYLTHNRALIVDWKHDSGILIDNPHIFHMLESHYKFMHAMGTRIKHEEFAKLLH